MIRITKKRKNEIGMDKLKAAAESDDWLRRLNHQVGQVAEMMMEIHGGRWNITISHETCFVLISREIESWRLQDS
jgi:hypothetical protein